MGIKDVTEKNLEGYADVFADIINVLLFDGRDEIKPAELIDSVRRSIYKADGKIHEQERDVAKYWVVNGVSIALIGIENQSCIDEYMPIRIISYDGAAYRNQIKVRDDIARRNKNKPDSEKEPIPPIYPVMTLVLYFGDRHWDDQYKHLNKCLKADTPFADYLSDYTITVSEIQYLSDETVCKFKSDFKYVASLFTQYRKVREGKLDCINIAPDQIIHAKEVMELLVVFVGDESFEEAYNQVLEGGRIDMIPVFDSLKEQAKREGRAEGKTEGAKETTALMTKRFFTKSRQLHPDWSENRIQQEFDLYFAADNNNEE